MSKEKLKGRCTLCENLGTDVVKDYPRYPMLPAPEFPFPSYYKCKSTNELIRTDDVETKRDCEHFMKIKDEEVLWERMKCIRISTEDLDEMF